MYRRLITCAAVAASMALTLGLEGYARAQIAPGVIDEGHALYMSDCAACHGKEGKGDGPVAAFLTVKAPDLTGLAARNGGKFNYWKVYKTVDGTQMPRAHGDSEMPVWGKKLTGEYGTPGAHSQMLSLVFYLESIQKK
ncbi:MAG TPA: cytochrome c [Candidatus Binataceae bacterium]|nr:cytochrome c [Candidatus Binataceae bacterium]